MMIVISNNIHGLNLSKNNMQESPTFFMGNNDSNRNDSDIITIVVTIENKKNVEKEGL